MGHYGRRGVLLGGVLLVLSLAALVVPGHAQERGAQTRIDLFDRQSNRTGSATVNPATGRIDFYDTKSNRTGYGVIDGSGTLQRYDLKGNRTGTGQLSTDGTTLRPGGRR